MRPRLAPSFTVVVGDGALWLIAGEDVRYRLGLPDPAWLAKLIERCDGRSSLAELLDGLPPDRRADAEATLQRLHPERVLVDGTAAQAHVPLPAAYRVSGTGELAELLRTASDRDTSLDVLVQDRLDHAALLDHNRAALAARRRWMWITTGPAARAFVGPLFVPDAGPCAECLLVHGKRLSPVPEAYDALLAHAAAGHPIAASDFPRAALATVAAVARWKLGLVQATVSPAALYALHVIEVADLTVTSYTPIADPDCACSA